MEGFKFSGEHSLPGTDPGPIITNPLGGHQSTLTPGKKDFWFSFHFHFKINYLPWGKAFTHFYSLYRP